MTNSAIDAYLQNDAATSNYFLCKINLIFQLTSGPINLTSLQLVGNTLRKKQK